MPMRHALRFDPAITVDRIPEYPEHFIETWDEFPVGVDLILIMRDELPSGEVRA